MLLLRDALRLMEQRDHNGRPVPFPVTYVTANKKTGEGGDIVILKNVVIAGSMGGGSGKSSTTAEGKKNHKKPNHNYNETRNFHILDSGEIKKCHIRLITHMNNQPIYY